MPEGPSFEISNVTAKYVVENSDSILEIAADVPGEYWTVENFLDERPLKWKLSFVVTYKDNPIAYAILSRRGEGQGHLHHFMVQRRWRGHSIGRLMMAEIERRLSLEGLHRLTLKVRANNREAQSFYRRHGFCLADTRGDYNLYEKEL